MRPLELAIEFPDTNNKEVKAAQDSLEKSAEDLLSSAQAASTKILDKIPEESIPDIEDDFEALTNVVGSIFDWIGNEDWADDVDAEDDEHNKTVEAEYVKGVKTGIDKLASIVESILATIRSEGIEEPLFDDLIDSTLALSGSLSKAGFNTLPITRRLVGITETTADKPAEDVPDEAPAEEPVAPPEDTSSYEKPVEKPTAKGDVHTLNMQKEALLNYLESGISESKLRAFLAAFTGEKEEDIEGNEESVLREVMNSIETFEDVETAVYIINTASGTKYTINDLLEAAAEDQGEEDVNVPDEDGEEAEPESEVDVEEPSAPVEEPAEADKEPIEADVTPEDKLVLLQEQIDFGVELLDRIQPNGKSALVNTKTSTSTPLGSGEIFLLKNNFSAIDLSELT